MAAEIRIRGRILLLGNMMLLTLVFLCFSGIILLSNFTVMLYENLFSEKLSASDVFNGKFSDLAVSAVLFLLSFALYSAIKLGTERFFLRRAQKKDASARDIFYYFHPLRFHGALLFMLKLKSLYFFILLVCLSPFVVSAFTLFYLLKSNTSVLVSLIFLTGTSAFLVSGIVFFYKMRDMLFLCSCYYIEAEKLYFRSLAAASLRKMKNKRLLLQRIRKGFSGWFLLCIFLLPLSYVWSYYNQTLSVASVNFMKD